MPKPVVVLAWWQSAANLLHHRVGELQCTPKSFVISFVYFAVAAKPASYCPSSAVRLKSSACVSGPVVQTSTDLLRCFTSSMATVDIDNELSLLEAVSSRAFGQNEACLQDLARKASACRTTAVDQAFPLCCCDSCLIVLLRCSNLLSLKFCGAHERFWLWHRHMLCSQACQYVCRQAAHSSLKCAYLLCIAGNGSCSSSR